MAAEYNLFRVKFIRPKQTSFLHDNSSPSQLLLKSVGERPSAEFRKNYVWHIGNIKNFNNETGFFAVGRTTKTTLAKFDEHTKDFVEEPSETSPYTFVVFDSRLGILAIGKKTILAQSTLGVATVLERLLSKASVVRANDIEVEVDIIPDPSSFIQKISSAHALRTFSASFTGPNPFDADELFQKPLSVYLKEAGGMSGNTTIKGLDLDRAVVEEVARSTAATGNEASAKVVICAGQRSIRINMKGDPVKLVYEDAHSLEDVKTDMIEAYHEVRHDERRTT